MTQPRTCPDCGGSLPPDALDGACPRCLLAAGLEGDDGGAPDAPPRPQRPEPPSVAEIAAHFPALVVEELIGAGGMGIVYRARQSALDRMVALKVLWPQLAQDKAFADRFTREARAMARLDHPNIVRVFEFGERDGLFFLVMEHVAGKSLRELMDAGGIHPEEALAIVPQICAALQYAHDQGVVHRDIKPANVLVDTTGRVRIADFGLAKLVEGEDVALTRAGQVMGTLHYMAPEQYRTPDHVDHRADIYSLGVVFYEMLTGEVPVGRFEAPSERVHVDVRLDQVVLRSLEREPERRYQKASDVGTAVTSISSGEAPPPAPTPVAAAAAAEPAVKPPARLSKLAVASLVMVGVQLVFALVAFAAPGAIVLSIGAGVLALGMGLVALVRVLSSGGRLRGAAYAVGALLVPWFLGCGGLLLLGGMAARHGVRSMDPIRIEGETVRFGELTIDESGVRIGDWVQIDDDGVRVNEPIEIDDRGIRRVERADASVPADEAEALPLVLTSSPFALDTAGVPQAVKDIEACWALVQATARAGIAGERPPELLLFYTDEAYAQLGALDDDAFLALREQDMVGLPLIRPQLRDALERFEPFIIEFAPDGDAATVTVARDGPRGERLRFEIVRSAPGWAFPRSRVEVIPAEPKSR